jgi:hypothetical protein
MAQPEQRICGITVKCESGVDAEPGGRTILCMIWCAGSWACAGMWMLAVLVTSLVEQLVEV